MPKLQNYQNVEMSQMQKYQNYHNVTLTVNMIHVTGFVHPHSRLSGLRRITKPTSRESQHTPSIARVATMGMPA